MKRSELINDAHQILSDIDIENELDATIAFSTSIDEYGVFGLNLTKKGSEMSMAHAIELAMSQDADVLNIIHGIINTQISEKIPSLSSTFEKLFPLTRTITEKGSECNCPACQRRTDPNKDISKN